MHICPQVLTGGAVELRKGLQSLHTLGLNTLALYLTHTNAVDKASIYISSRYTGIFWPRYLISQSTYPLVSLQNVGGER